MKHQPTPEQSSLYDDYFVKNLVPDDHPLLQIGRVVDFSFVRELVEDLYSPDRGREAIDPALLLRLCFVQVYYDLSDREVIDHAQVNLAIRCFLHLCLPAGEIRDETNPIPGSGPGVEWSIAGGVCHQRRADDQPPSRGSAAGDSSSRVTDRRGATMPEKAR